MFGPSEEVRRVQAAEAIGLKDIPAANDEFSILIKRQEVQGLSVDMERLTEQAKWKRTVTLNEEEGEGTYGDQDHAVELVTGSHKNPHYSEVHWRKTRDRLHVETDVRTATAKDTMLVMARFMGAIDVTTSPYSRLMVGHHKFCGNMTVAITVPSRPKMKSTDTPTATPLRKRSESGAGNHSLWSRQCGV